MEKFYKILLTLSLVFVSAAINAQQNIALQATVTGSTCNTGACATLNDNVLGTCGTQIMWVSTSTPPSTTPGVEWIQFTWSSTKTMNRMVIHHAQTNTRFLAGALIQSWNGTTWVNVSTFSNLTPACSSVVNFPVTNTTRLRITSFTMSGTQLSNPNFREIEISGPNVNNDASVTALTNLNTCTYNQAIAATITNYGKKNLDSFRVSWSVNNVFQSTQYINSNLATGFSTTVNLTSAYTFAPSTFYTIRAWTTNPNGTTDSVPGNDMFTMTLDFMGSPADPTVTNFTQCGRGFPTLSATTTDPADSVFWYDASTGGNMLGLGKNITGPYTIATRTFYASAAKLSKNFRLTTIGTTGVNVRQTEPYGGMQTITTNKTIMMDSLAFRLWYATPTNVGYSLYYRVGSHVGFTTTPNGWIKLSEGVATYITVAGQNFARVSANKLNLPPGTYSFYLTTDLNFGAGNSFYSVSVGPGASNADMSILTGGNIIIGMFGSTQTLTYQPQIEYIYKNQCVSVNRTPLTVTVKPRPLGADVLKSTPFQGRFRLGMTSDPDVIEVNKTVTYELKSPTGYNNADYGSTWLLTGVDARTKFNVQVPSGDYSVNAPVGNNNATLSFKPKSVWLDSLITFTVRFIDLGPHFCDSSVTRTVYVAPTPKPNFIFPNFICLGDQTLFENQTTIHSGVSTYKWYFGDGDSSDLNSPVHEFKNPGTYDVRLVAKSFRWDVIKDTMIQVTIGEVPTVDFKVSNACQGVAVNFANQTFIGNGTLSYQWNFGDNSPIVTTVNASRSYAVAGPYQVTLTAEANGCKASKTKVAYQFAKPVASFIKLTGNCLNDEFTFANNSVIGLGQFGNKWDFDDAGNIASDKNPKYKFTSPGVKDVKLTAISEFGCKDSFVSQVLVRQIPSTDFTYPYTCERSATQFNNTTNLNGELLSQYLWEFGNGINSSATHPLISWPAVGQRTIKLSTFLNNGCSSSVTKIINVGVQPKADFEFDEKCSGEPVTFSNLSTFSNGKIEYEWNFGDNNKTNVPSPQHNFNSGVTTQSFNVQLKASIEGGCADSIIKTVTIEALPLTCDFTATRNWSVSSKNFVLTPVGGSMANTTYTWILGDGNRISSNSTGTNYTYNGNLKYCITMIAINVSGCECSTTRCVEVSTDIDANSLEASISVYPNPNSGQFSINTPENTDQFTVYVYSVTGELVYSSDFSGNTAQIDLSNAASGIYTVKVQTATGISTQMITISK